MVRNAGVTVDLAAVVADCVASAVAVDENHKKNVWNNFEITSIFILV